MHLSLVALIVKLLRVRQSDEALGQRACSGIFMSCICLACDYARKQRQLSGCASAEWLCRLTPEYVYGRWQGRE